MHENEQFMQRRHKVSTTTENGLQKSIREIIQEVSDDICNNYCKYRDEEDDDYLCNVIKNGGNCPLDRLQ